MLQGEHSAILSTFIKLPFVIKIFVLSIFEWPFYTGFTVFCRELGRQMREERDKVKLLQEQGYKTKLTYIEEGKKKREEKKVPGHIFLKSPVSYNNSPF